MSNNNKWYTKTMQKVVTKLLDIYDENPIKNIDRCKYVETEIEKFLESKEYNKDNNIIFYICGKQRVIYIDTLHKNFAEFIKTHNILEEPVPTEISHLFKSEKPNSSRRNSPSSASPRNTSKPTELSQQDPSIIMRPKSSHKKDYTGLILRNIPELTSPTKLKIMFDAINSTIQKKPKEKSIRKKPLHNAPPKTTHPLAPGPRLQSKLGPRNTTLTALPVIGGKKKKRTTTRSKPKKSQK